MIYVIYNPTCKYSRLLINTHAYIALCMNVEPSFICLLEVSTAFFGFRTVSLSSNSSPYINNIMNLYESYTRMKGKVRTVP